MRAQTFIAIFCDVGFDVNELNVYSRRATFVYLTFQDAFLPRTLWHAHIQLQMHSAFCLYVVNIKRCIAPLNSFKNK